MNNTQEIQEWTDEFDEKFPKEFLKIVGDGYDYSPTDDIKSFISQKLKEQVNKIREEIETETVSDHSKCFIPETCIGYQSCLSDVLNILSKYEPE